MKQSPFRIRGLRRRSTNGAGPGRIRRTFVLSLLAMVSACTESAETGPTGITEPENKLTIQSVALPGAEVGQPYAATLQASGGSGSYSWSLVSGRIPAGLALEESGLLHGTPSKADSGVFTVQAEDAEGNTKSQKVSLKVKGGPPRIRTRSLPAGTVGVEYSQTLDAEGGSPGYAWGVAAGSLPPGLSLSASGVLDGTPSEAGASAFTVRITDQSGDDDAQEFTLEIQPAAGGPVIETSSLPDGRVGSSYAGRLEVAGGTGPYVWSVADGALPEGLGLTSEGAIAGTPTTVESSSFTVRVTDAGDRSATRELTIDVADAPTPPRIETSSLPNGQVGASYSVTLAASGGTPVYTWSLSAGSLPTGLSLSGSGRIEGTPTTEVSSTFTVQVADQNGLTDTQQLSIEVAAEPQPPVIQTTSLPGADVGSVYSATLEASGGTPGYAWGVASGSLPSGLSLSGSGEVSGTPTSAGTSSFTVRVTDENGLADTQALSVEITAAPEPPVIQTTSLPGGEVGSVYSATLEASGGTPGYAWDVASGSLPSGLSLSGSGEISGTPTSAGTSSFTVRVTDENGLADTQALSIEVRSGAAPVNIVTTSLPDAELGRAYSVTLVAEGGGPPYAWALFRTSSLPQGLSLSSSGVISGTPTTLGTHGFTVTVEDQAGAGDAQGLSVRVIDLPNQRPTADFSADCSGLACSMRDLSSDPDGGLVAWSWDFGDGATSSQREPSHQYSGTGAYVVTLTVTDDEGATSTTSRTVAVSADEQPGFQIDLYFDPSVPTRMRDALREAADHWERIIQTDLTAYGPFEERSLGDRCDRPYLPFIDDVAIVVNMVGFGGSTLARAGPCIIRTGPGEEVNLPVYGSVEIDTGSDGWTFNKSVEILKHEVGHVLGIGPTWRSFVQAPCGEGGVTPYFAEPNAVREFGSASGRSVDRVYVQMGLPMNDGSCRPGGHWGDLMESELMSPSTSLSGPVQPLSAVTIGALEDLGWMVDYSQADPFVPRDPAGVSTAGAEMYTDIVVPGPLLPDPGPSRRR